ncbi:Fic family protein [Candidatus Micrarchaeota archaeon]|nr:Fic family protein [Candidatus Micrarchaeota archaeon]
MRKNQEPRKNSIGKSGTLLFHLAYQAHAFTDGNKRTSIAACATFL